MRYRQRKSCMPVTANGNEDGKAVSKKFLPRIAVPTVMNAVRNAASPTATRAITGGQSNSNHEKKTAIQIATSD